MNPDQIILYECVHCGYDHEEEYEALECCGSPIEKDGWQCGECGEIYPIGNEAKECCKQ